MRLHLYRAVVHPTGLCAKVFHHPQCQIDVRARDDLALKCELQAFFQHRANEQESRDELRADVARDLELTAFELMAFDAQGRKAFLAGVFNVSTQRTQSVNQDADGSVLHALRTSDDVFAGCERQICREKTHGRTCCLDVDDLVGGLQGVDDHGGVVAVR